MLTLVTSLMPISSSEGGTVLILEVEVVAAVVDKIPFAIDVVAILVVLKSEVIASVDDLVVPFVVVSTDVDLVVFLVLVEIVVGFVVRLVVVDLSVVGVD